VKDNYGLLIASLVAIVAIVGLVILFSGAKSGASVWHPDTIMRPCSGDAVGSACVTRFSQQGRCLAHGNLWSPGALCGVDVGCYCEFQR